MNILVLGSNGMIGNAIFLYLSYIKKFNVKGSLRKKELINKEFLWIDNDIVEIDPLNLSETETKIKILKPDLIINCLGITKHVFKNYSNKIIKSINTSFPHFLAKLSEKHNFRLIQISTDCVFSGDKGNYNEFDNPDAEDFYGKTKKHGEILNHPKVITIRTSTIGHEVKTKYGLLEWFLSQNECFGFYNAIFSGLTNLELAKIINGLIIPNENLHGLYHIGGLSISKYDLLKKINNIYKMNVKIKKENKFKINRSLNSEKFINKTNYSPKAWDDLIKEMRDFNIELRGASNVQ